MITSTTVAERLRDAINDEGGDIDLERRVAILAVVLIDEFNAEIERQIGAVLERVEVLVSANRPEVDRDLCHGAPL